MAVAERFTSADLALMPDDNKRYEIIEGELYVSKSPGYEHQYTCGRFIQLLSTWNDQANLGVVLPTPGVVFAEDDDVVPDVVWISRARLSQAVDEAGHLRAAPELVIEVLSPGKTYEERDRQIKLKLYSRRGVLEYWIASWIGQFVEVHRRDNAQLHLTATLYPQDLLESPLLPGFSCTVAQLFFSSRA